MQKQWIIDNGKWIIFRFWLRVQSSCHLDSNTLIDLSMESGNIHHGVADSAEKTNPFPNGLCP